MEADIGRKAGFHTLSENVIEKGLCMTCGACAGVCPSKAIEMRIGNYESDDPVPTLTGSCVSCGICSQVCAGAEVQLRDTDIFTFGRERNMTEEPLGIYRRTLKGYALGPAREKSSSGGIVQAVLRYALTEGVVDAVIMAVRDEEHPWRAKPGIVTRPEDVGKGVRSVMESVPVDALLHRAVMEEGHKRIAVVGMPCQIHSIRKLQMKELPKPLAKAIVLTIGLYCNSTAYYTGLQHLILELGGVERLTDIQSLDTRAGKFPGTMVAALKDGKMQEIGTKSFYGSFLSIANFRRDRCLMCMDFSAESADISVGDVFQPSSGNPRWSGIITRTEIGDRMIDKGMEAGFLHAEPHDPALIPASGYGWEMSKHASVYRLNQRRKYGWPTPDFQYPMEIKLLRRNLSSSKG